jgi:voltage-gated potassium channel
MDTLLKRFVWLTAAMMATVVFGTAGYMVIEGYSFMDALYMTAITITTVGYLEVHPLSQAGRLFTILLLAVGVSLLYLAIGIITGSIIHLELGEYFGKRRVKRMVSALDNHVLICGFGRVGRGAAEELQGSGIPFVVLDTDAARVERAIQSGMIAVVADATQDRSLIDAGILRARGLIACLGSDANNLYVILSARTLNPKMQLASRVAEEADEPKFRRAGADTTFSPYRSTGNRLAQAIIRPHVLEFLNFRTAGSGQDVTIEEVQVGEGSGIAGKTLVESNIRREAGVIVLGVRHPEGAMQFNPDANTRVRAGDFLIVMGERGGLAKLEGMLAAVPAVPRVAEAASSQPGLPSAT